MIDDNATDTAVVESPVEQVQTDPAPATSPAPAVAPATTETAPVADAPAADAPAAPASEGPSGPQPPEPQENENIQPALVNSAVAVAGLPLPEGNREDALEMVREQTRKMRESSNSPTVGHQARHFHEEFDRRSKATPFLRFVATGEPLPIEIANVDKVAMPDGSGTWYMFPTSENLWLSYGNRPEDPTQGQEAQGGPLHGITGRGEKYAGGNVETDMVADEYKRPQFRGKGSQTGGTGVQRAHLGDASSIGAAVEDPDVSNLPDQHPDQDIGKDAGAAVGHLRPLPDGAHITQTGKGKYDDEPGIIRRTTDVSKLRGKNGMFEVRTPEPEDTSGDQTDKPAEIEPTSLDTSQANLLKEGEKTATEAAAAGAVTAGNSASDIEQSSPGVLSAPGEKAAPDASEGTAADTQQPTVDGAKFVDGNVEGDAPASAPATAGDAPAMQKSDEATPQTQAPGAVTTLPGAVPADGTAAPVSPPPANPLPDTTDPTPPSDQAPPVQPAS